jgi:acetyl esterase/lipase
MLAATMAGGLSLGLAPSAAPVVASGCTGSPSQMLSLQTEMGIPGLYALPAGPPRALALFGHGYQNSSASWTGHLADAASRGIIAVAPDYTGLGPAPDYRGWPAAAGAADLVAAAEHFYSKCASYTIKKVVIMGVSMGGNMTGLAVASNATRTTIQGKVIPLFDYWIDVEGVANIAETWAEATAVSPANAYAAEAKADIEAETGGTPVTALQGFLDRDVVLQFQRVAAHGLTGAVMIHSIEDGLVPYNQSREIEALLRASCKRVDFYSVLRRGAARDPGHDQTTILSDVSPVLGAADPFSGHAWEGSSTHIVMVTAMNRLFGLALQTDPGPNNHEYLVDSGLGTVTLIPSVLPTVQPVPGVPCELTNNQL